MTIITRDMLDYDSDYPHSGKDVFESVTATVDGKRYLMELASDYDSTPDGDCYDEDDKEAWHNDVWSYVGMIVTPLDVPESAQIELEDSLWGLEFDFPLDPPQEHNGVRYTRTNDTYQFCHYPGPDMIDNVASAVKKWEAKKAYENYALS